MHPAGEKWVSANAFLTSSESGFIFLILLMDSSHLEGEALNEACLHLSNRIFGKFSTGKPFFISASPEINDSLGGGVQRKIWIMRRTDGYLGVICPRFHYLTRKSSLSSSLA